MLLLFLLVCCCCDGGGGVCFRLGPLALLAHPTLPLLASAVESMPLFGALIAVGVIFL